MQYAVSRRQKAKSKRQIALKHAQNVGAKESLYTSFLKCKILSTVFCQIDVGGAEISRYHLVNSAIRHASTP